MTNTQPITAAYEANFDKFVARLQRTFRSLNSAQCEDLVQFAFVEALTRVNRTDLKPVEDWAAWLWTATKSRAKSFLKSVEYTRFVSIERPGPDANSDSSESGVWQPTHGLTPSHILKNPERQERGQKLLSDVLAEFVAACEAANSPSKREQKEVFERRLRGQTVEQIASGMVSARRRSQCTELARSRASGS